MNLLIAEEGKEYIIDSIETDDEELDKGLYSQSYGFSSSHVWM